MKPYRIYFTPARLFVFILLMIFLWIMLVPHTFAATGIRRTVDFQGKIVNKTSGTNIADGDYSFTFKFYDAASTDITPATDEHLVITPGGTGNVGIGTTEPSFKLDVNGTFRTTGNTTLGDANSDTLTINAGTSGTGISFADSGGLVIANDKDEAVVTIDTEGNAYFAGNITAKSIKAEQVEGLTRLVEGHVSLLEQEVKELKRLVVDHSRSMSKTDKGLQEEKKEEKDHAAGRLCPDQPRRALHRHSF